MGCNTIIYFVLCFWATELNWDASYLNQSPIQCWTRSIYMACMCQNLVNTCFNLIITLQCYIRILYVLQNLKNKVKSSQDSNVGLLTYGKMFLPLIMNILVLEQRTDYILTHFNSEGRTQSLHFT